MSCLRYAFAILCFLLLTALPASAQLVINEFSNGTTGSEEYVELLVVGTPTCTNSCVDLRGWIIDDNNGDFGPTGIAPGHMRFAQSPVWECVTIGTIIVIYNNAERNAAIPPDNLTGANCVFIVPANSTLFDRNTTGPSTGTGSTYPPAATSGGNWTHLGMNNGSDTYQTRDPNNITSPYHAISYGDNNISPIIYFATGGTNSMFYMTNAVSNDPFLQGNWVQGLATTNQTPGVPNNAANAAWIASLNNNCTPLTSATVSLGNDMTICPGETVTITAIANIAGTFTWNVPGSGGSVTLTPTGNTTVIVNFDGGGGCTDADTLEITIEAAPVGSIAGNTTICNGESTTLTASGGTDYVWSTTEVTPAITVSPTTSTPYSVTVTNAAGCSDTVTTTVTVNLTPTGNIAGNTTICAGESTTLTASGGSTYLWSTTAITPAITVSPASTTPFTVTVTDANGCSDTVTSTVTVNPAPVGAITGDTAICAGGNTTLTASGGTSYIWSTTEITPAITVSPLIDTGYSVTVTNANGCRDTVATTVTVAAPIIGSVTGNLVICQGESTTLTANGGTIFIWSTGENTQAITVSPTTTTTYSVTVSSGTTCSDTVDLTVTVNPGPTGTIEGDSIICPGESTVLTALGGTTFLWSTSSTGSSITVSPTTTTPYSVTITDANGCADTVTRNVTVSALPTVSAGNPQTICEGGSATLTATGGGTYLWSTTETGPTITVSPTVTTDYSVTVTNAAGCVAADTVTVAVNPNNIVLAVDSIHTEACEQGNGRIVLQSPNNFVTYVLVQNGVRIDSVLGGGVFFDLTGGTYDVIAIDNNGCQQTLTGVVVPVTLIPQATATAVSPTCFGDTDGSITLASATTGMYYSLNGGAPQQGNNFSGLAGGTYTINLIDSVGGCTNTINYTLAQPDPLVATILPDSTNILAGNEIELTGNVTGGTTNYNYQWIPSSTLDCEICPVVNTVPQDSLSVYFLVVTDANGCTDTARAVVRVSNEFLITVPSGFTPNGDRFNDFLRPLANEPIDFFMMVFNRWGEKIYEGDGMPGWDGSYKREQQPMSTYVYVIEYTRLLTGERGYLTGSVTLLR